MNLQNTPTLVTERLILRKFNLDDIEALFKIYSDIEINKFLPWYPVKSLEETKELYKKEYEKIYNDEKGYHYAICLKSDNIPIGYIKVEIDDSYDFGYALCKEFWHKGIMIEAGIAVIEQLRKDKIPYITATHDVNNQNSGKVMKRLGMKYQYSYEEQWQPKDILVTFRMYQLNLDGDNERVYKKYWNMYENHFVEEL